jgi:hypothetical protein
VHYKMVGRRGFTSPRGPWTWVKLVSLSVVRCALRRVESSIAVFHRSLDLALTAPVFDTFGSFAWYPCSCDTKPTDRPKVDGFLDIVKTTWNSIPYVGNPLQVIDHKLMGHN